MVATSLACLFSLTTALALRLWLNERDLRQCVEKCRDTYHLQASATMTKLMEAEFQRDHAAKSYTWLCGQVSMLERALMSSRTKNVLDRLAPRETAKPDRIH